MNLFQVCLLFCAIFQAILADLAGDLKMRGLTTLLDLVVKADLAETLGSVEPATIFAPTNEAFAKVPQDVLNSLLNNKQLLKDTLLNHVIPNAAIKFSNLKEDNKVSAAGGNPLRITVQRRNGITRTLINGVSLLRTDIMAGSGSVVHTVNDVVPTVKESDNVAALVSGNSQFSTLLAAVKAAGLANALSSTDGITVFAPTNAAFAKIPAATLDAILADKDLLTAILTRHVVPKVIYGKLISQGPKLAHKTLNPKEKIITSKDPYYYSPRIATSPSHKKANIVKADILASNGVVHAIDSVV